MSTSDDPRGFRRGQPNNTQHPVDGRRDDPRQPARPDQRGNGARQGYQPRQEENYGSFADSDQNYVERPAAGSQRQAAAFSAFRPEAYAEPTEKPNGGRAANADWPQEPRQFAPEPRAAVEKRPAARPQPEPFRPQPAPIRAHDPYAEASNDPYDTGRRDFANDWNDDSFQPQQAAQFAATDYYAPHDDPNPTEVQSVHNRFFAADDEPERAPPQQAAPPQAPRYRQNDFVAQDYPPEPREQPRAPKPAPSPSAGSGGFDEGDGYRWDSFEQQPPAPEAARPSYPIAKISNQEDELDADYFADEEEFEGEDDYAEAPRSGSKKLMAAVLVGAVVTGGGLAYFYKAQTGGGLGSEPPILTADSRPVKERPTDPGGREFPNGTKLIYDRLADANGGGAEEATRVASTEEPGANNRSGSAVVTTGANGTLEERIKNALNNSQRDDASGGRAASPAQSPDEPRRVQTQIFRPDGSVETSRPPRDEPAPASAPRAAARAAPPPVTANLAAPSPQPARNARVAEATPAQANISGGGDAAAGMFVQIAARNDEAAAKAAYADLQQKYAGVLGTHSPSVRKVDLGDKGVWYRLLVGPMPSKGEADKLCEDLKSAGMKGCFSRKE